MSRGLSYTTENILEVENRWIKLSLGQFFFTPPWSEHLFIPALKELLIRSLVSILKYLEEYKSILLG